LAEHKSLRKQRIIVGFQWT